MKTCVIGSYPKIPAQEGQPSVRAALHRFERRQIGPRQLEDTFRAVTGRTLELFTREGLDLITDGQIRWNDLLDPVARDIDNLDAAGLERYFDNNFYYRQPVITGRLSWAGGTLAEWTRLALDQAERPLKVALPGPFTVLLLSRNTSYADEQDLLNDLIEVLRLEAESVAALGVAEIQWDEPALVQPPRTSSLLTPDTVTRALTALCADAAYPQGLALYYGDSEPLWDLLSRVPVQRVYLDLVSAPRMRERLSRETFLSPDQEVGLGLVDARSARLETPGDVAWAGPILTRQGTDRVWIHPNSGLELLPPDRAAAKVGLLRPLAAALGSAVR
ncbi:5-methyltetrahydropteroyltriglutamate--homocysteine methyltransferase [Candidatus Hydrogenisulfobacillus filiaventi]|uniref:5-methyltetrahydropteroyltriglutamate--homocysteine methyltransferase n=1 Tax=Candidatus Hydrogenisulfobacillus filiaventi TaxID=2707344 RepID=A0A6F8ZKQ4_9FIRM|nr:5-methyltetrahydropteroyltriglutamate--homocysteine methyltransferase [Candidatus Hydrogenisulfobacillus filiaventi]